MHHAEQFDVDDAVVEEQGKIRRDFVVDNHFVEVGDAKLREFVGKETLIFGPDRFTQICHNALAGVKEVLPAAAKELLLSALSAGFVRAAAAHGLTGERHDAVVSDLGGAA